MALTFISTTIKPNYIAESSDIVAGTITGVALIGGTVYTHDDGRWYIIEKDLTLSPYMQNMSMNQFIDVDLGNSSTDNLTASGSFVGVSLSTLKVVGIQVSLKTDQNCIIYVEQSPDNINWDISDSYYYNKLLNNFGVTVQAVSSYVRVVVVNQSTSPTTYFRLQTVLCPIVEALPRSLDYYGNLKVGINSLKDRFGFEGQFTPVKDLKVAQPYKMVGTTLGASLDPNFISATYNGGGALATVANSIATVTSGSVANGYAQLQSVPKARYIFGQPHLWKAVVRCQALGVSNNTKRVGMFSTSGSIPIDGAYFQFSDGILSVNTVSAGSVAYTTSSGSFNGDLSEFVMKDTNAHTLEIMAFTSGVYFYIDNYLVHTFTPTDKLFYQSLSVPITVQSFNSASGSSSGTLEVWNTSISRMGREITAPVSKYLAGTTSASGIVLKGGSGALHNVLVSNVSNTANITVYDSASGSSTNILYSTGAMSNNLVPFNIPFSGLPFFNGLTVTITGANCNATLIFE